MSWTVEDLVRIRDFVDALCAAIDAGTVTPTEGQMMAVAEEVSGRLEGSPFLHDMLVKLASRSRNGRAVLAKFAH